MLKTMRKKARYFYVLFVIVILSFVFWGTQVDNNGGARPYVVEMGEEKVMVDDYYRRYRQRVDTYREVSPEKLTDEMMERIKEQTINSIVTELVLVKAAEDAGITVTDRELEEAIMADPVFSTSGVFSSQLYARTLEVNGYNPARYEALKRRELLVQKMQRLVESSVELSPSELEGLQGGEQLMDTIKEALLRNKRNEALTSYVNGLKEGLGIVINRDIIS